MLQIYPDASAEGEYSQDGFNTNPIRWAFDGRIGGVIERLYYLRNDDEDTTFTAITIIPNPNPANDIVDGDDGYSIKLRAGTTQPTAQEWATISPGNEIAMDDLTDSLTFLPFWLRIEVPKGAPVDTITGTTLRVEGTEGA